MNNLKIYKYRSIGSVSAIKIDNRILCMGWYTYTQADQAINKGSPSDTIEILGHNVAAMIVWKGTIEFETLNKTFSMLEKNYRKNAEEVLL